MSRPIKFRAWNRRISKMKYGVGVYGDLLIYYMDYDEDDLYIQGDVEMLRLPDEDFELMQYTGKQDSKGRDIYQDDIVKIVRPWPEIAPSPVDKEFYVLIKWSEDACGFPDASAVADGEVIGNFWEHPHLRELVEHQQ